jgi:putative aldouronate transport system permease protein
MFLVCTASYALSNKNLVGGKIISLYFLITMYISGGIIPYYLVVTKYLHLNDNIFSMVVTSGLGVWSFLVLRTFFRGIPESLTESALIDGATEFQTLIKVIIPLSMPAIATLTLFSIVAHWNELFRALFFINNDNKQPLQIGLRRMIIDISGGVSIRSMMTIAYQKNTGTTSIANLFELGIKSAAIMVATLPIVFIYPFLQKYFAKGVMIGSIKG